MIPHSKLKSYGDCAFSAYAPKLWNDIQETMKCSADLTSFKCNLKTYHSAYTKAETMNVK